MKIKYFHYLLIAPVQVLLLITIGIPALYILWLSFQNSKFGNDIIFSGLNNYIFVLQDTYFWKAALNTFIIVNVVVYIELLLSTCLATFFAGGLPLKRLFISVILAPYAMSEVVAVVIWKYMFEPEVGIITTILFKLGFSDFDWSYNPNSAIILICLLSIWLHFPFSFLIIYSARLGIPQDLYESSSVDGAKPYNQLLNITIPLLMPAILVALMFRYVFAFRLFSEVWLLTGGGPARQTEVLAIYLYRHAFRYHEFGIAAAIGWLMVIATLLISSGYLKAMYKKMLVDHV